VLVAVIVPAEVGGEAARLQHLGDEHRPAVTDGRGPPRRGGRLAVALGDRLIEGVDARVVPGLVAVDERARTPWLLADVQGGATTVDRDGPPRVEGQRGSAAIVELALDDDPALVGNEPGGRQGRAGLPVEGERVLVGERCGGARIPLTIQLDGADRVRKQWAVAGGDREGTGLLVGERL